MVLAVRLRPLLACLCTALVAACGSQASTGPAQLHRSSQLQPRAAVALSAAGGEDLPGLLAAARRLAGASSGARLPSGQLRTVRVVDSIDEIEPDELRILFASAKNTELAELFAQVGIEPRPDGFEYGGEIYLRGSDAVILTLEDPHRPGRPLSLGVGNTTRAVLAQVASFEPAWRPGFRVFRQGLLERSGRIDSRGQPDPRGADEIGHRRAALLAAHQAFTSAGLRFKAPGDSVAAPGGGDWSRWVKSSGLRKRLVEARAALEQLWPADEQTVGLQRGILLVIHAHLGDKRAAIGDGRPASFNAGAERVDLVASPAGLRAAPAAWLEAGLAARLGGTLPDWTCAALAQDLADDWYGRSLAQGLAHLERGGLVPGLAQLCAPQSLSAGFPGSSSPLVMQCARAGLMRFLRRRPGGVEQVRRLCAEGPQSLTVDSARDSVLESEWRAWLRALPGVTDELSTAGRDALLARTDFLGGLHVVAPAGTARGLAPGYGTRACDESLAAARAAGARAVALTTFAFVDPGAPEFFGVDPCALRASADAGLVQTLGRARELDLVTYLRTHVQAGPSTTWSAWMPQPGESPWARTFDDLEAQLLHLALVAELGGCDLLGLGSGLQSATVTRARALAREGADSEPSSESGAPSAADEDSKAAAEARALAGRLARARSLVRRVRAIYAGALTYGAGGVGELQAVTFWDELDYVGLDLFASLARDEDSRERLQRGHLVKRFGNRLLVLRQVADRFERPALLTEIGLPATDGGWDDPRWLDGDVDLEAQASGLEALALALRRERERSSTLRGLFLWRWTTDPAGGGASDRSWTVQNKPAERALPGLFRP